MRPSCFPALATLLLLCATPAAAQIRDCPYSRDLSERIAMPREMSLRLKAAAGSLVVRGVAGLTEAQVRGTVCASNAGLAELSAVRLQRDGDVVSIETVIPEFRDRFTDYASVRIDLIVEVPLGAAASVDDASGSAELSGLGDLELHDGSGDLHVQDITGRVVIHDGSGSVEIQRVSGAIEVFDGSGDVVIREAASNVVIQDGSGSIDVNRINGQFTVLEDGSGHIEYANVRGPVDVPRRR